MDKKTRTKIRMALLLPILVALVFGPAGSFHFWQGWVFLAMFVVFNGVIIVYFLRRDRKVLERRMESREPRRAQRIFQRVWMPLWIITMVLPGFDYRFGWSAELGGVPLVVVWLGFGLTAAAWLLVFEVMRFNTFASTVVRVEEGHKVITDGPYRFVRHPMYTGFAVMILAAPFALGSYVAVIPAVALIPMLIFRLRDEERALRDELPGYAEYCDRTRYRLIPSIY